MNHVEFIRSGYCHCPCGIAPYYVTVRSTAYILLQGVPSNIALGEVRKLILQVKGVLDLHELHVWQLSETKVVASVHISASREYDFMQVAAQIQEALHNCGIHSTTIQPEYLTPGTAVVRKVRSGSFMSPCGFDTDMGTCSLLHCV